MHFGMRQNRDFYVWKIAGNALRDVARRREHATGSGHKCMKSCTPRGDVESPLARAATDACSTPPRVGFAAIATILGDQMVLRTDRIVVMQRTVVRHARCA